MIKTKISRSEMIGETSMALCGGALAVSLLLVAGLLALLAYHGMGYFWQDPLDEITLRDGRRLMGEVLEREVIPHTAKGEPETYRIRIKVGNRDLTGHDFVWIDESEIAERSRPTDAIELERLEWGNFYGRMKTLLVDGEATAEGAGPVWDAFEKLHPKKIEELDAIRRFEKGPIGEVNREIEGLRLARRRLDLENLPEAESAGPRREIEKRLIARQNHYEELATRLHEMRQAFLRESLVMTAADGTEKAIPVGSVVRAIPANRLGLAGKLTLYGSRVWEFLSADPRESNTEGGIFPAIFGTVMMVFLMSFIVSPLGVLAAIYLREYAKEGLMVRMVRIAVNNLAGVPSIVFGVFGLGFFVYIVGGAIDRVFYPEALPAPTYGTGGILWASLTLALLTVPVVIVASEEGLAAVPRIVREGSLALGATKFETIVKVVVPAAAPGILTGMILAMARAAGEVAPLMIVGMVKLAPDPPLDGHFPFVHLERKFMHLGFHIYDVGFQSPNVEATKPLVFATALLLVLVVVAMNLIAISIRNHLRRKYAGSAV